MEVFTLLNEKKYQCSLCMIPLNKLSRSKHLQSKKHLSHTLPDLTPMIHQLNRLNHHPLPDSAPILERQNATQGDESFIVFTGKQYVVPKENQLFFDHQDGFTFMTKKGVKIDLERDLKKNYKNELIIFARDHGLLIIKRKDFSKISKKELITYLNSVLQFE